MPPQLSHEMQGMIKAYTYFVTYNLHVVLVNMNMHGLLFVYIVYDNTIISPNYTIIQVNLGPLCFLKGIKVFAVERASPTIVLVKEMSCNCSVLPA